MACSIKKAVVLVTLGSCVLVRSGDSRSFPSKGQMRGNSPFSKWRPSHDTGGIRYIGSRACAKCHTAEAESQLATPMGQAFATAADCQVLITRPRLTFRNGPYSYEIKRLGNRSIYTVSDSINTISEPILFCFGQGKVGQTYTFRHNGLFYETRVSYFQEIQGLDFTIGHQHSVPTSLEEGLGRRIAPDEERACYGCHTTGAINGSRLRLEQLMPGVGCEACHGPGEKHVMAVKAHKFNDLKIFNPRSLSATELTQSFCGTCHTSFEQAMLLPGQSGINNIRFQPYRIFNSPGHNKNDARISCTACHDPHENLERDAVFYDSKCLACHLPSPKAAKTETRTAPACPVSSRQCVTCHMPRVEFPGMHASFTDHWIRIVKPNGLVPN